MSNNITHVIVFKQQICLSWNQLHYPNFFNEFNFNFHWFEALKPKMNARSWKFVYLLDNHIVFLSHAIMWLTARHLIYPRNWFSQLSDTLSTFLWKSSLFSYFLKSSHFWLLLKALVTQKVSELSLAKRSSSLLTSGTKPFGILSIST